MTDKRKRRPAQERDEDPIADSGQWAARNGYDLDDRTQLYAAIDAYCAYCNEGAEMMWRSVDDALGTVNDGEVQFSRVFGDEYNCTVFDAAGDIVNEQSADTVADALGTYDVHFGAGVEELLDRDGVETVSFWNHGGQIICSIKERKRIKRIRGVGLYANDALKGAIADYGTEDEDEDSVAVAG